jgi:hypothetical protein
MVKDSDTGDNKYGANPKEIESSTLLTPEPTQTEAE